MLTKEPCELSLRSLSDFPREREISSRELVRPNETDGGYF